MQVTFSTDSDIEHKADMLFQALREADVIVLDVDDTLYHAATGVHDAIKKLICDDANHNQDLAALKVKWANDGLIEAGKPIQPAHLGTLFPLIVNSYRQQGMDQLTNYLARVYDVDYSPIPRQRELVSAVGRLRAESKKIVIYTNGPWGVFNGKKMHVNKVLDALGFPESAFGEKDIIDLIKIDRQPELLARFGVTLEHAADAFRKPTVQGFLNACAVWGVEPQDSTYAHVAYLDDGFKNLQPVANNLGVTGLLMGLDDKPLADMAKSADMSGVTAKFWTDRTDADGNFYSIAGSVLSQLADTQPMPLLTTQPRERLVGLMMSRAGAVGRLVSKIA